MPYFNRTQQGVILLLGAGLLLIWAWRANFGRPPATPPAPSVNSVFVEVEGAVSRPGVYSFPHSPELAEIRRQAGGPLPLPPEGDKIASGSRLEITPEGRWQIGQMRGPQLLTLGLTLELNRATLEDLDALPGIGPVLAGRIVDYRRTHGPFKTLADLGQVSGIGPKKLEQIKAYLFCTEPETADHTP